MAILKRINGKEVREFYGIFGLSCKEVEYITVFAEKTVSKLVALGWELVRYYM